MNPGRILSEHRPLVLLIVLVSGSLFSLLTGAESSFIHRGLSRFVNITAYPLLKLRQVSVNTVGRSWYFVVDHDRVYRKNVELTREVAALRVRAAQYPQIAEENARLREMLDFVRERPRLSLQPAAVLESYRGMLRIEGGAALGIQPAMGVISPLGVVGVVTEVADFTSTVATIHHMDCRIGAMVLRNQLRAYDGVIHASGSDFSHLCAMEYIDMKEDVRVGDWVTTSPESQFPAGLPIGRITRVRGGMGLWKSAEVSPIVDPYRLNEVLVIMRGVDEPAYVAGPPTALAREEASLDSMSPIETRAPRMPDMRSLQERYAP